MGTTVLTVSDLQHFKTELFVELRTILKLADPPRRWLKSSEVKKLLKMSDGTLQTLRINGTLHYSKIGGIIYYDHDHIQKTFQENFRPDNIKP